MNKNMCEIERYEAGYNDGIKKGYDDGIRAGIYNSLCYLINNNYIDDSMFSELEKNILKDNDLCDERGGVNEKRNFKNRRT